MAVVAVVVSLGLIESSGTSHSKAATTTPTVPLTPDQRLTATWSTSVTSAFSDLDSVVPDLLTEVQSWEKGTESGIKLVGDIDRDWPDFLGTRLALAKLQPLSLSPQALSDYRLSAELYIEAFRLVMVVGSQPSDPLLDQVQLSTTRLRELGDRVYDQATAALAAFTPQTVPNSDVEIIKPADVPLWTSISLAAGPPLDAQPAPTKSISYQASRPQQSVSAWIGDVQAAGIPAVDAEVAAIEHGTTDTLRAQSDAFIAASTTLTSQPDPTNGRPASTRLRLGLLVDAEAARTAEAGTLLPASLEPQVRQIAETLALVGDQLWASQLGPRATGFPPSLLSD